MFGILGMLCSLVSVVCWIIVLVHAFRNEVWKGIVGLICGLYALYYGFTEYDADNKGTLMAVWIGSIVLGIIFRIMGGGFTTHA
jgi:hypothetical protein